MIFMAFNYSNTGSFMAKRRFIDSEKHKLTEELLKKADHKTAVIWACECADHVLSYFEEEYPDDDRPRKAIKAGRLWVGGQIAVSQARKAAFKAHTAARDVDNDDESAVFAARSAAHAAATVHVKGHAMVASTYATKAVYFYHYPDGSSVNVDKERDWQYKLLVKMMDK
jgi:hypothetical protein